MGRGGAGCCASGDAVLPIFVSLKVVSASLEFRLLVLVFVSVYMEFLA